MKQQQITLCFHLQCYCSKLCALMYKVHECDGGIVWNSGSFVEEKLDEKEDNELVHQVSGISSGGNGVGLGFLFVNRMYLMLSQLCLAAWIELLFRAQMHFKGKIYPRDSCGLRITQTAAVSCVLSLQGKDGEKSCLVRELQAVGWSWKPEHTFLGQRKRGKQLLLPCICPSDQFLEISNVFIQLLKSGS